MKWSLLLVACLATSVGATALAQDTSSSSSRAQPGVDAGTTQGTTDSVTVPDAPRNKNKDGDKPNTGDDRREFVGQNQNPRSNSNQRIETTVGNERSASERRDADDSGLRRGELRRERFTDDDADSDRFDATRRDGRDERGEFSNNGRSNRDDSNHWRYKRHNGEWWYWHPNNYWVFWRGNTWTRYDSNSYRVPDSYRQPVYREYPDYEGYGYDNRYVPNRYYYEDNYYGRRPYSVGYGNPYYRDYDDSYYYNDGYNRGFRGSREGRIGAGIGGAIGGRSGAAIGGAIGEAIDD